MHEVERAVAEQNLKLGDYAGQPTPGLALAMDAIPDLLSRPVLEQLALLVFATSLMQRSDAL